MSDSITAIFELLNTALILCQGYFLQYYFGSFLKPRGRSRHTGLWVAVLYTLLRTGLDFLWSSDYEGIRILGKQAVFLLLLAALILCFYKALCSITIFLLVSFQAVRDVSLYMAVILLDKPAELLLNLWNWCVGKGFLGSVAAWSRAANLSVVGIQFLRILFILLLMGVSLKKIVNDFREKDLRMGRSELLFILIPALTGLLLCMLLRVIMITVEQDITIFLYKKYPALAFLLPGVLLLSLLSILQGVKSFQEMIHLNREKNSRLILEKQVEGMQEHMGELERVYSGVRSMKHDMKNTLAVLSSLVSEREQQENEELKTYLAGLNETMNQMEFSFHTGNAVVDALLHMKYHEALQSIPDLKLYAEQLIFSRDLPVRSYDIGIILGNALDNALEALRRLKEKKPEAEAFIRLISFQKGRLLFLRVENSFDGRLLRKPQEEFPVTEKPDKEFHGIGLRNIKHIAESYEGTVDWNAAEGIFTLAVMLKIPAVD